MCQCSGDPCRRAFNQAFDASNQSADESSEATLRPFLKKSGMRDSTAVFLNLRTQKVPSALSNPCSIVAGRQEREE